MAKKKKKKKKKNGEIAKFSQNLRDMRIFAIFATPRARFFVFPSSFFRFFYFFPFPSSFFVFPFPSSFFPYFQFFHNFHKFACQQIWDLKNQDFSNLGRFGLLKSGREQAFMVGFFKKKTRPMNVSTFKKLECRLQGPFLALNDRYGQFWHRSGLVIFGAWVHFGPHRSDLNRGLGQFWPILAGLNFWDHFWLKFKIRSSILAIFGVIFGLKLAQNPDPQPPRGRKPSQVEDFGPNWSIWSDLRRP